MAELPGIRRVEQIMGMPIVVDVRDDPLDEALIDRGLRLVPRGRRDVQHLQGRQRDQPTEPRRARASRVPDGRALGDRPLPRAPVTRLTATSTPRPSCPATIDPSGSSRAGRSTALRRCSTPPALRNYALNAGGDIRLRGDAHARAALARGDPASAASATGSRRWSKPTTSPSPRRAPTHGASTSVDPHTGPSTDGRALGDDRRARPRNGRRLRDGRLRHGRAGP